MTHEVEDSEHRTEGEDVIQQTAAREGAWQGKDKRNANRKYLSEMQPMQLSEPSVHFISSFSLSW